MRRMELYTGTSYGGGGGESKYVPPPPRYMTDLLVGRNMRSIVGLASMVGVSPSPPQTPEGYR